MEDVLAVSKGKNGWNPVVVKDCLVHKSGVPWFLVSTRWWGGMVL